MDNTVLSDIKIAKHGYTILLRYMRYTYGLVYYYTSRIDLVLDLYFDRMPYNMKIIRCSESLALPKIGKGR